MTKFFVRYLELIASKAREVDCDLLEDMCGMMRRAGRRGGKVVLVGNGGSAAIAGHIAVDLTNSAGIRAVCFNEGSLITCLANDYGNDQWMSRAIESYGDKQDVAVLISSSGRSANIVNAAEKARSLGMGVATLSGFFANNPLRQMGDVNLWVDSDIYNVVETVHTTWLAAAVDRLALEMRQLPALPDERVTRMTAKDRPVRVKMEGVIL